MNIPNYNSKFNDRFATWTCDCPSKYELFSKIKEADVNVCNGTYQDSINYSRNLKV